MDHTNRQIANYRVITRIGVGGFASIWKAHRMRQRKETVAIKIVLPEHAKDRHVRAMFDNEWKVCRGFDHPALLHYREAGQHEGMPYVVMEYFDSRPLKSLIVEKHPLVRRASQEILTSVAAALAYIHQQGVVHRDLKPENILVGADAQTRLIDFSIAQTRWQRWTNFSSKTPGTPAYMAPEVLAGKHCTVRSDLYAFGAILFEMFAGRPPFVGDSQQAVMQQHQHTAPPRLSRLNKEVSPALDKLVAILLAKDPATRLADAETLVGRLKKLEVYAG